MTFNLTQTLLIIVIVVLTTLLVAIGVQIFMLLKEARGTLKRVNDTVDRAEEILGKISHPTASLGNLLSGVKEGARIIETVTGFFKKSESEPKDFPYGHE